MILDGPSARRPTPFEPGDVFAGRYRMVTSASVQRGLGEVWRADDLVLHTPVALKLIHAASARRGRSVLSEVRLARQITHPRGLPGVRRRRGGGRGLLFDGAGPRRRPGAVLRRAGRLPSEKVVDIGRQLCAGLAAPTRRASFTAISTLATCSSTQTARSGSSTSDSRLAAGHRASVRYARLPWRPSSARPVCRCRNRPTLYALGVMLYELLVGRRPLRPRERGACCRRGRRRSCPTSIPQLERVILQALAPDPRRSPGVGGGDGR